ncbi:MAG: DeoR/GlpR family DNA-binding transcription regulator [Sphaerochaetaceae bacterium]|jgi:DeoR/GlpR family transcriptional regulator of sugar metabolism
MVGLTDREVQIVELLQEGGEVSVSDLSDTLKVSSVTIRSDLKALESKGIILRGRGVATSAYHPTFLEKQSSNVEKKESIAKAAAQLVDSGDHIMINNGTTCALIGRYLLGKRNIHIVSNSTLLFPYVRVNPNIFLTMVGGDFRGSAEAVVGQIALEQLQKYHVSVAFAGTDGLTVEHGLTTHLPENAEIARQMWHQASKRVLVADSSKYGKIGFVKILPLDEIDVLVTDSDFPSDAVQVIREMGVHVILA